MTPSITFEDIQRARSVIADQVHMTPVLSSISLGRMAGCELLLKAENLQRAGSFKVRGAVNKIAGLNPAQKARGVIAASAGNHAQGVALAAGNLGIDCTIVMPKDASIPKVEATRGYGAKVVLHGEDFDQAMRHARRLIRGERADPRPRLRRSRDNSRAGDHWPGTAGAGAGHRRVSGAGWRRWPDRRHRAGRA